MTIPAEARTHRHGHHSASRHVAHRVHFGHHGHHNSARARGGTQVDGPASAAIVVDANTGRTVYARNENELRHPASITKVMTLYLLFEQLEKGRIRLDSPLMISAHAAAQAPSKLGLAPGETIDVENAIKAVVTKSANDVATAIAENIGGDEDAFAQMMTRKAHALGMTRTHYANASGLPNDEQITTARDLAILGRAIQDRFPRYYRYFSTNSFAYRGGVHRNHNHLLGRVQGLDGIKTGYTRASGFNLLSSVRRGGRRLIAVVLGGHTAAARDRAMTQLITDNIEKMSPFQTAHAPTESAPEAISASAQEPELSPAPELTVRAEAKEAPAPAPVPVGLPLSLAPLSPLSPPGLVPTLERADRIRPAFVPGGQKHAEAAPQRKEHASRRDQIRASADGSTSHGAGRSFGEGAATTPPSVRRASAEVDRTVVAKFEKPDAKTETSRPAHAGWMIQIGATDDAEKANQLLARARSQIRAVPASARGFTEKVQRGKETLWRARFAGLEEKAAESACKALKRSGFSCFTTKQ